MKENGINVRTYQDGKPFEFEVSTVYSKSLEFVAVHVNKDMDMNIELSDSKHIEVRYEDNMLLKSEFKYMDIITDATGNNIVYDLVIFHNGNIQFIIDYLKMNDFDQINSKLNRLLRENKRTKIVPKEAVDNQLIDNMSYANTNLAAKLHKIPNWIRYLFNAS